MASTVSVINYAYGPSIIAASVVLPVLAIVTTGLRFISRSIKKQGLGRDDWLLVPAVICLCGLGACLITGVAKGVVGYPTPNVDSDDPDYQETGLLPGEALLEQIEYAFFSIMILNFGLVKLAVLFFYRRIFVVGHSIFNVATWIAVGFSILWTIGFFLAQIFGCNKYFDVYWGPLAGNSTFTCVNGLQFLLSLAATDFASDVVIFFMPFPLIWQLQMTTKKKLLVTGVLLLGAVSLAASIVRLIIHVEITDATYAGRYDVYLTVSLALYWTVIEAGIAMIAINLPLIMSLAGTRSVQSVIQSVRSTFSLHSLRNVGSRSNLDRSNEAAKHVTAGSSVRSKKSSTNLGSINEEEKTVPPVPAS